MPTPFSIYGPFEFDKNCVHELDYRNKRLAEIDEEYPRLLDAKGVYLFSVRNHENYTPLYVGATKKHFVGEIFNANNLLKIATHCALPISEGGLAFGTLTMHLLAKENPHHASYKIDVPDEIIWWVERFVLFFGMKSNPHMWNKSGTQFLQSVAIEGVTNTHPGKPARNVASFINALNWSS